MPESLPTTMVSITHPDGLNLRFSERLISFLVNRPNPHLNFLLGQWIATLEDESLYHLEVLSSRANLDPESLGDAIQDLLLLVATAISAETRQPEIRLQEEGFVTAFGGVCLACIVERFARAGWLVLEAPCSILPHSQQRVRLTEAGRQQGQAWTEQFKAMMH